MSDKPDKPAKPKSEAPESADGKAEAAPAKGKLPIKTIIAVAVIMALEAAVIVAVLSMTGPKPTEAAPDEHALEHDTGNTTVELVVVEDGFQNLQTGRVWVWDTSIYVQVKEKNAERVESLIAQRGAEIKEAISQIFSRATHAQLKEPERQTLNRQLTGYFHTIFADSEGKPLIERVMIPKCRGFPADI